MTIPVAYYYFVVVPIFNPSTNSTSFSRPLGIDGLIFFCLGKIVIKLVHFLIHDRAILKCAMEAGENCIF